jgi:hypothetical protein
MSRVTSDPSAGAAEPAFVVHVVDAISAALAGHDGVEYRSPPLPREEALALVRVLLGDDRPAAETHSWRCPIAGGQRTVKLEPAQGIGANANGASNQRTEPCDQHQQAPDRHQPTSTDCTSTASSSSEPGIESRRRARVEIRHSTEKDWLAGGRTFASGEEMLAPSGRAPRTPSRSAALTALH